MAYELFLYRKVEDLRQGDRMFIVNGYNPVLYTEQDAHDSSCMWVYTDSVNRKGSTLRAVRLFKDDLVKCKVVLFVKEVGKGGDKFS